MTRNTLLPSLLLALFCFGSIAHADSTIVILRHGEKPEKGLGQLSCKGLNRSLALPQMLLARYGDPIAIYAPDPAIKKEDRGSSYAYVRPLATIEPLAVRAGLPVAIDWGMTDISPLAARLLETREGLQVVVWEHHWAEKLARKLLAATEANPDLVPLWQEGDYDSLFVIRVREVSGKTVATFTHEQEGLEHLSDICPNQ